MAGTSAVRNQKKGVVSCWVCTGMILFMNILRLTMLRMNNKVIDWIFIILTVIWVVISVVETVKYLKNKKSGDGK